MKADKNMEKNMEIKKPTCTITDRTRNQKGDKGISLIRLKRYPLFLETMPSLR